MVHGHNMLAVQIAHPEERTVTYQAVTRAIQSVYLDNGADAQVAVPELLDGAVLVLNVMQRMNSGFRDCIRHCGLFVYIGAGINKPYTRVTRSFCLGLPYVLLVAPSDFASVTLGGRVRFVTGDSHAPHT
jgi:hypothetical protein